MNEEYNRKGFGFFFLKYEVFMLKKIKMLLIVYKVLCYDGFLMVLGKRWKVLELNVLFIIL